MHLECQAINKHSQSPKKGKSGVKSGIRKKEIRMLLQCQAINKHSQSPKKGKNGVKSVNNCHNFTFTHLL
ncbi:hypothetical protein CJ195_14170 [Bacillus sp. UMB0899]|nr:hypothetical protein CJ195_14170 [Bacillus sp. UMB0899]